MILSALPLAPSPVPLAPLPAAAPTEVAAAPVSAPAVSSFDAMLAAIGPADAPTTPSILLPATATAEGDKDKTPDAPTDSAQPDSIPAVLVALVAPPPPLSAPSVSVAPSPPVSVAVLAAVAPRAPAVAAPAIEAVALPDEAQGPSPLPVPIDAAPPQPQPAGTGARDAAPTGTQQTPPVAGGTVAVPVAPRRDAAPDKKANTVSQPAIDIEALFPGGGDRPLTVTFARDGQPTGAPPASLVASPAPGTPATPLAPSIVATAAQAVAAQPPARENRRADDGATIDANSTTPLPFASAPPVASSGPVAPASQPVPAQQIVLQQHLDLAHDGAWLDSLARDIANSADSDSRLSFRLNPAHLGSLHVELSNGADGTSIRLTAETEAARAILVDSRHHLVAEARAQGVRVAETQIDVAGAGEQGANPGSGHQQGGGQAHMARPQQNLLTILPQTRPITDAGASSVPVRERYA